MSSINYNKLLLKYLHLVFLFVIFACESGNELPFPLENQKLVINCFASPNDLFKVKVQLSSELNAQQSESVRDSCIVEIQIPGKGSEFLVFVPDGFGGGSYSSSSLYPQPGNKYKLRVLDPKYGSVSAEEVIPFLPLNLMPSPALKILKRDTSSINVETIRYNCNIKLPVNPTLDPLYYHLLINEIVHVENGNDFIRPALIGLSVEDNTSIQVFNGSTLLISSLQNTGTNEIELDFECLAENKIMSETIKEVNFEVRVVSKNYFNYFSSINYQLKSGGNPLENPPPLFTNIKEGLGIFGGYNQLKSTIKFPD